jgi:hypothetical protein
VRRRAMIVVGAFALLLAGCGGGGSSVDADPSTSGAPTGAAVTALDSTPFACPDPQDQTPMTGADTLPRGAKAALICYRDNHDLWFAPAGSLTEGVGRLVRMVNAQDIHPNAQNENCNADLGPAYSIVFRYADGTRTITGENDGCHPVMVGSTERGGARRLLAAFLNALARQRMHVPPPDVSRRPPACPTDRIEPSGPLADPAHVVAASLCTHLGGPWGEQRAGLPFTPAQVAVLRRDLATAKSRIFRPTVGGHHCRSLVLRGPVRISALDQWGDQFVVDLACDTYTFVPLTEDGFVTVHLLPATARMLGHLLAS